MEYRIIPGMGMGKSLGGSAIMSSQSYDLFAYGESDEVGPIVDVEFIH